MSIGFRPAAATDIDHILTMMQDFYAIDYVDIPFVRARQEKALQTLLGDASLGRLWVILDQSETIGYIAVTFGFSLEYGRDAMIDEVYLGEGYRGQGFGALAVEFIEEQARALEIEALHLEVAFANHAAQRIYERAGFAVHGTDFMTKWLRPS